jgi:hypothetical protein
MEMDSDNTGLVQKSRCPELSNSVIPKPGKAVADTLAAWLQIKELPTTPAPSVSGDGHSAPATPAPSSAPAQTWGQKIDAAKSYLREQAPHGGDTWEIAKRRTWDRIATWPSPHREAVDDEIERIEGDMLANVEPIEFR